MIFTAPTRPLSPNKNPYSRAIEVIDKSYLHWPFFEDRHRDLAAALGLWAEREIAPLEAEPHNDVDGLCSTILEKLAQLGWLDYAVTSPGGGKFDSLDVRSLSIIRETLARYSGLADFVFAMQGLGSGAISLKGSDQQKADYLDAVRKGEKVAAFALTEPGSGSDVANLEMSATLDGDEYILSGEKTFISNAGIADFYCLFARTGTEEGAKGISAFIVDAQTPGHSVVERIETLAPHPLGHIRFDGCRVPATNMIGVPGEGFKIAMATLDIFRSTVGAAALGFARRALGEALGRAASRQIYGGTLADLQITQASLGEMALNIDASALLIYRAAWLRDTTGTRITKEAAMAKLHATEAAQKTIDAALQLFGGQGVVAGETVEKLYREIRALRIYEGASEVQKMVIARALLAEADEDRK
jgi:acyl-CoA dehydrogenase